MPKRKTSTGRRNQQSSLSVKKSKYFPSKRLKQSFYDQSGVDLAKALLGKKLVRIEDDERMSVVIVETEAYLGLTDKAAHSYNGKRTNKTEAMFMKAGTAYVYHIYGLYCCMNISSQGEGCAVLLRAVEPDEGTDKMKLLRWKKDPEEKEKNNVKSEDTTPSKPKKLTKKEKDLSNGPSKMCQALNIRKAEINKIDLTDSDVIWLEDAEPIPDCNIINSARININYAEDWTDKLLRFYILNNDFVSVRDKSAEELSKKQQ